MDRRRLLFYGLLGVIAVIAVMASPVTRSLWQGRPAVSRAPASPAASAPGAEPGGASPAVSEAALAAWRREHGRIPSWNPFLTAADDRASPTTAAGPPPAPAARAPAPAAPAAPLPLYRVRAILISEGLRVAAIDSRLVSEGDQLGEERVAEIRSDAVVLEHAGARRAIELGDRPVRILEEIVGRPARSMQP